LKAMTKDNFIRVITLISILLLFFSQSVYDPSVYAKMQKIEDDNLSDVTGEALFLEINATVSSYVTDLSINQNEGDSIHLGPSWIGQNSAGTFYPSRIYSSQLADLGSLPGQTWILLGNLEFPYTTGGNTLDAYFSNLSVTGHYAPYAGGTTFALQSLGNVAINGFQYGHNVYGITPWLNCGDPPFVMYSANDVSGLELFTEFGGYVNQLTYRWNSGTTTASALTLSGIYLFYGYGNSGGTSGNPAAWSASLTGKMKLGGSYPSYNTGGGVSGTRTIMASINIGTSGTRSIIFMDMPTHGSIRIRNLNLGGLDLGPVALDDVVMYRNMIEWNLNAFQ
jgi:hypothetical protein